MKRKLGGLCEMVASELQECSVESLAVKMSPYVRYLEYVIQ
jgi:hypothetical protein